MAPLSDSVNVKFSAAAPPPVLKPVTAVMAGVAGVLAHVQPEPLSGTQYRLEQQLPWGGPTWFKRERRRPIGGGGPGGGSGGGERPVKHALLLGTQDGGEGGGGAGGEGEGGGMKVEQAPSSQVLNTLTPTRTQQEPSQQGPRPLVVLAGPQEMPSGVHCREMPPRLYTV